MTVIVFGDLGTYMNLTAEISSPIAINKIAVMESGFPAAAAETYVSVNINSSAVDL